MADAPMLRLSDGGFRFHYDAHWSFLCPAPCPHPPVGGPIGTRFRYAFWTLWWALNWLIDHLKKPTTVGMFVCDCGPSFAIEGLCSEQRFVNGAASVPEAFPVPRGTHA